MPETTPPPASAPAPDAGFAAIGRPALRVALTSGGDERLALDPRSGRNRYGVPAGDAGGEISFASSTASPVSPRGHAAAGAALARLLTGGPGEGAAWTETIRARLLGLYGVPGAEAILTASGTEAEFVVLALARALLSRPITNLVLAPGETGSGVVLAAAGRHFLASSSLGASVERGTPLAGVPADDVDVVGVDIRDRDGTVVASTTVDHAVVERARAALRADRDLLVHCLDTSKTGLGGFSRSAARALRASAGGRCLVVVDACQLRCSADAIRRDLADGFMVMITGSKFAGGPPFSGAVLVPPTLVARLGRVAPPPGLAAYSAAADWPARLRPRGEALATPLNIGLGLRWEAALAELERVEAIGPGLRGAIVARFATLVGRHVRATDGLALVVPGDARSERPRTIFPVLTRDDDGHALCARALHRGLMAPGEDGGAIFHVGQPVDLGASAVLRVCLAAPQIVDVAARAATLPLEDAMAPLEADLRALFDKWATVRAGLAGEALSTRRRA